jgi:nucleotide-binding universal stress UspA family protein
MPYSPSVDINTWGMLNITVRQSFFRIKEKIDILSIKFKTEDAVLMVKFINTGGIKMFKKLIIATDLSAASFALVKCLGGLRAYGAEECLLLQCLSIQETSSLALSYTINVLEGMLRDLKEILAEQGYIVETRIIPGIAKNEVNKIAINENYSLIVVGAQEHSLTSEIFFGGLAYDVIHYAQKPVLLIRMEDYPQEGISCIKTLGCDMSNHILFPTDFSENADLAFDYVAKMAALGVKKITLFHVQDKSRISEYPEASFEKRNEIDNTRLQDMKKLLQEKGNAEIDAFLCQGSPAVEILKLIRERNIQLVVMGSQGRGFVKEIFLGSVSNNVARHSAASVLLIPAKREND